MPKQFDEGIREDICKEIIAGKSLVKVCEMKSMPSLETVYQWLASDPVFSDNYARAKELREDAVFEECLSIADDAPADEVAKARLKIDTRKWMLGKMAPKKYGDKQTLEHTGKDGAALPAPVINVTTSSPGP